MKLFGRREMGSVDVCERCGCVCDAACRATALLEDARLRALTGGTRL
jgi:hypothetical protein